jgi:hypothetical protein
MYTLEAIQKLRDRDKEDIEYCNVLSETVYREIYPEKQKMELVLREEWEERALTVSYAEYAIDILDYQLNKEHIAFELANSSGSDRTFMHEFVLFNTNNGAVRLDSYGQDEILRYDELLGRTQRPPGYVLYCARIVEWPTWKNDLLNY